MTASPPAGPVTFPEGFLWGASTAGHQVEGGNLNADLWAAEWAPDSLFVEPSGDACDSYHRYGEDVALLAGAGLGTYRFGIEWARVEPEDGWFSRAAIDHYRRLVDTCRDRGVTPVPTYNHFTTPRWFAERGGWTGPDAADRFAAYCQRVHAAIGDVVDWACTLNEPNVMAVISEVGFAPIGTGEADHPRPSDAELARIAALRARSGHTAPATLPAFQGAPLDAMADAHRRAGDAIRSGPGTTKVGWTLALVDFQAAPGGEERHERVRRVAQADWLEVARDDDFVGVQTYTRERIGPDGLLPRPTGSRRMTTGWEDYPDALAHTVRFAWEHAGVPILVTENGCATDDDDQRIAYTERALRGLAGAIAAGCDVRGYLHWSLLDNFEWLSGYAVRFGLVAVDRSDFTRAPKPSLAWLGEIARANALR